MQALSNALFNNTDLEKLVRSQTKLGTTFFETQSCFWGPICDDDEDID